MEQEFGGIRVEFGQDRVKEDFTGNVVEMNKQIS